MKTCATCPERFFSEARGRKLKGNQLTQVGLELLPLKWLVVVSVIIWLIGWLFLAYNSYRLFEATIFDFVTLLDSRVFAVHHLVHSFAVDVMSPDFKRAKCCSCSPTRQLTWTECTA